MSLASSLYMYVDEDNKPSHVLPFLYLAARLGVRFVLNVDPRAYAPDSLRYWWSYSPHHHTEVGDFRYARVIPFATWDNLLGPNVLRLIPRFFSLRPCCGTPWFPTYRRPVRNAVFTTYGCSTHEYSVEVPQLRLSVPAYTESRIAGAFKEVRVHGGLLTLCQCTLAHVPVVVNPLGNDQYQNKIFWDRLHNPTPAAFMMTQETTWRIRKLLQPFIWRTYEDQH